MTDNTTIQKAMNR